MNSLMKQGKELDALEGTSSPKLLVWCWTTDNGKTDKEYDTNESSKKLDKLLSSEVGHNQPQINTRLFFAYWKEEKAHSFISLYSMW